jgi:hypothetical protein
MLDQRRIQKLRAMSYEEYLKTSEWAQKRDQALERDGHRCRACNSNEMLHVHHRTYERRGNEDLNDLTTLCQSCHEHFHKKMSQDEIMKRTYTELIYPSKESQIQKRECHLIGMLIQDPSLYQHIKDILSESDFLDSDMRALYHLFSSVTLPCESFEQFVPSDLMPAVSRATGLFRTEPPLAEYMQVGSIVEIATRLRHQSLSSSLEEVSALMREASKSGDVLAERRFRQQSYEIHRDLQKVVTVSKLLKGR